MFEELVKTYSNECEARLLADRLKGEGIMSVVKPLGPGYGLAGPLSFIPHAVFVMPIQSELAKEIAGVELDVNE